jgi:hypothetical protein
MGLFSGVYARGRAAGAVLGASSALIDRALQAHRA